MKSRLRNILFVIVLSIGVASCALVRSDDPFLSLTKGMTREQVQIHLRGYTPFASRMDEEGEEWEFIRSRNEQSEFISVVVFQHGRVVAIDSYERSLPPVRPEVGHMPPLYGDVYIPSARNRGLRVMSRQDFSVFYQRISNMPWKEERLKMIYDNKSHVMFLCSQVRDLMRLYTFDDERLQILEGVLPAIADLQNRQIVIETLRSVRARDRAREMMAAIAYAPPVLKVLPDDVFEDFLYRWRVAPFKRDKEQVVNDFKRYYAFRCIQVRRVLDLCDFDSEKMVVVQALATNIADPVNKQIILDAFTFRKDRDKVRMLLP